MCFSSGGRASKNVAFSESNKTAGADLRRRKPASALADVFSPSTGQRRRGLVRSEKRSRFYVACPTLRSTLDYVTSALTRNPGGIFVENPEGISARTCT